MTHQTHKALDRLMDEIPVGTAPVDTLLAAGRAAKRRKRRALVGAAAAATAAILGGGVLATHALTGSGPSTSEGAVAADPTRSPTAGPTTGSHVPVESVDGTWTVQALFGTDSRSALPDAYRGKVRLTFDDGRVVGTTGCNDVFGTYQHDGADLRFPRRDLGTTLVGCTDEPPLVERLEDVRHVSQDEDAASLSLHDGNWMVVAVLDRSAASASNGSRTRHTLMTHCGVLSTVVDGRLWLATPPLGDDSGNPPRGWDENQTEGWFERTSATAATFTSDSGQLARFRLARRGEADPAAGCE